MDSFDFNTRLPPRKRLLAGLKKEGSDCHSLPPIPPISGDLYTQFHDLFISTNSSPDEIVEASKAAASAAADLAARARDAAMEKAVAAAKAKAAAKNALEFLDSIMRTEARRENCAMKSKSRKKHIEVKLLYKNKRPFEIRETDEELARRLHHDMNSSPRISRKSSKKRGGYVKRAVSDESVVCNERPPAFDDKNAQLTNGCPMADLFESEVACKDLEKHHLGSKGSGVASGKRVKMKQKKMLLSNCNIRRAGSKSSL